jgi:hypothetical protein
VQGGAPFQTETSVDGISTQNVRNNTPLSDAFPSAESIAEIVLKASATMPNSGRLERSQP